MQHKARIRSINLTLSLSFIINSGKRGGRYLSNGRTKVSDLCEITPILEKFETDSPRNENRSKTVPLRVESWVADFPSFLTIRDTGGRPWENLAEYNGAQWSRPRTVWVLVIKCITRLVYTESGPRNLQSRLVCRFNRTLLGTEFMARPMVYNSETLYTTARWRWGGSNTDGMEFFFFFQYLFSVRTEFSESY